MEYEVQLDTFEGPLELLYKLIKKNKIEISEISLAEITGQYLDKVRSLTGLNLDLASEFMLIAVELIEIKAKSLLPGNKYENNNNKELNDSNLVQVLKEYNYFKEIAQILKTNAENEANTFLKSFHQEKNFNEEKINLKNDILDLVRAYTTVISNIDKRQKIINNNNNSYYISKEEIKIEEKIREILELIKNNPAGIKFRDIISNMDNKLEVIVSFLSILELAKLRKLKLNQGKQFSDINLMDI
jgi:segregation and condensation protein A